MLFLFKGEDMKGLKVILFTIFFSAIMSLSTFGNSKPFIVAGIPTPPYRYIGENGKPTGIDVEIIDYIMKDLGINYKIVLESSSPRLAYNWQNTSRYDMVMTYSYKDKRAKYLTYAKEHHLIIQWHFFIRKADENRIKFNSYNDFKNYKVGAIEGFAYTDDFWREVKKGTFKIDKIPKNETDRQLNKLISKRIDIVPLNTIAALYQAKNENIQKDIIFLKRPLKKKKYYNTFPKLSKHPLRMKVIKNYDRILKKMKRNGQYKKILNKYIGNIDLEI